MKTLGKVLGFLALLGVIVFAGSIGKIVGAGAVLGPFSVQGEYIYNDVDRNGGAEDADFDGWYLFASYFLTGESRNYNPQSGTFGRVKPDAIVAEGGLGAWELALRYSRIDLNDGPVSGGREDNITFGVNWYATPNIRFMLNYVSASPEKAGRNDDDADIYQARAQVDF